MADAKGNKKNGQAASIDAVYQKYARGVIRTLASTEFYDFFMDVISRAENEIQFSNRRCEKIIDPKWVEELEASLSGFQRIIANPRNTIREEELIVNVANERYATLAALAADREMTVEEIRAEYEELEMIRTYFGTEYGYNGWGISFDEITFVEDGNTVTLTAVTESWDADDNLQRTEKTSVWTRTGLAEYTVTGGDYIPVGSVLTPAS